MFNIACREKCWYRIKINWLEFSCHITYIRYFSKKENTLGYEHFSLRPKKISQRIILTPPSCSYIEVDIPASKTDISIDRISYRQAWLSMTARLAHYLDCYNRTAKSFLTYKTTYAEYSSTFQHRPLKDFPIPYDKIDIESRASYYPDMAYVTADEILAGSPVIGEWVIIINKRDTIYQKGIDDLKACLAKKSNADVVLLDYLLVHNNGEMTPVLSPEWNEDFFLSSPYLGHAVVFRKNLIASLSIKLKEAFFTFNPKADEVVDYFFCMLYRDNPESISNRVIKCSSVLLSTDTSESASQDYIKSRTDRLFKNSKESIKIEACKEGSRYRIIWPLSDPIPHVTLCVPTYNGVSLLRKSVGKILSNTRYENLEVIVIDNRSDCPETLSYLTSLTCTDSRVRVLKFEKEFNFSAINNFAVQHAKGSIIGLLNNDIEPLDHRWLNEMVRQVSRDRIGCVGAKLYYPNGRIQHAGIVLGIGGIAGHGFRHQPADTEGMLDRLNNVQNYSAVTAACLLVEKSVYLKAGGMDENLAVAYNDVDFCLKVKELGYRNLWTPHAELIHHESVSRGGNTTPEKRLQHEKEFRLMKTRWASLLNSDVAYHPLLTRIHEDFTLIGKIKN